MMLTVAEAAKALGVEPETVYRWISREEIPAHGLQDQLRLNDAELLEWATARGLRVSPALFHSGPGEAVETPSLAAALAEGGIHPGLSADSREEALRQAVAVMRLPAGVDRDFLFQVLWARERMGSTALGEGIAVPHPRTPIVLRTDRPAVAICSFPAGVEFDAPDGRPVDTLFTIVSPNTRTHLKLLAAISTALHDPAFRAAARRADAEKVLACARRLEAGARRSAP